MRAFLLAMLVALAGCEEKKATPPAPPPKPPPTAPAEPEQTLVRHEPNTLLGGETGLDHVGIAVKDLDTAERVYTELGFGIPQRGTLPNGLKNVNFYFADNRYIELMTFYDKEKADWLAKFLEKTEGANFILLSVFSIDETRAFLEAKGFTPGASQGGRIDAPGVIAGTDPLWHTMFFTPPAPLPGGRLGFIGYRRDKREHTLSQIMKTMKAQRSPHPNGAKLLKSMWMLVKDLDAARKAYEAVGMPAGRVFEDPRLGAKGVEIIAGQGSLLLLQPTDPKGKAAAFLERRGESIAGMSIEVLSLEKSWEYLKQHTGQPLPQYQGLFGKCFLLPPDLTYDVWMEMCKP